MSDLPAHLFELAFVLGLLLRLGLLNVASKLVCQDFTLTVETALHFFLEGIQLERVLLLDLALFALQTLYVALVGVQGTTLVFLEFF